MEPTRLNPGPYPLLIVATMTVLIQDLSTTGGANAWMYHHSTNPPRTWISARTWCQQHYTDMVAIQNQGEIVYLNQMLPFNPSYYWIGIRKVAGVWTWVGTKRSLTPEAQNWAVGEPNHPLEDCVEMYIKREKDTAKWNDERCNKRKGTLCYTASCSEGSCGNHADCVETIGNFTCQCHPGFLSPRCEEAVTCDALSVPQHGRLQCNDSYGPSRFNSSCRFHCELGYHVEGPEWLQCQASGRWDNPAPRCQVERCAALKQTSDRLLRTCRHPIANDSFNSTCAFSCEEGFELSGQSVTICDHAGRWTAEVPTCSVIACAPISPPVMGNMTCVDSLAPFSFGSSCSLTCLEGYTLAGSHTLVCPASGEWSQPTPTCIAVRCSSLKVPPHAVLGCQDPIGVFNYGSTCTLHCEEGFNLIGSNTTQCLAQGRWSHQLPVCQAMQCTVLSAPPHGLLSCSDPHGEFSFSSRCNLTCDEGFQPNGTAHTECSSLRSWSQEVPLCLAVQCTVLSPPPHGLLSCSDPHGEFSFSSRCNLTCDEGFQPNGTAHTECSSLRSWSTEVPRCLARSCPLLVDEPHHGWMNCSHPHSSFSYGSHCDLGCSEGFRLSGTPSINCNASGDWSGEMPTCKVVQCKASWLAGLTASPLSLNCSHPWGHFSFGSRCRFSCAGGYSLNGTEELLCSSSGRWSGALPTCAAVQCTVLSAPPHGLLSCSDPHGEFSFSSRCNLTCDEGFQPNGTAHTECSSLRSWSQEVPRCLARSCPLLVDEPHHGWMNCSHPHSSFSYGSHCDLGCSEGFRLSGTPSINCNTSGDWSGEMPTCKVVQCKASWLVGLTASPLSLNCSHPRGHFSFGSRCRFSCAGGYSLNGTEELLCSSSGRWSGALPTCAAVQCTVLSPPPHGLLSCSDPHGEFSFSSRCNLTCDEGFQPNGTAHTECSSLRSWSQEVPRCLARSCPLLVDEPHHGWMNCSHPHSSFSYGSHCDLGCSEGFRLSGTPSINCNASGDWSGEMPTCKVVQCKASWLAGLTASPLSLNCSHPRGHFSFGSRCRFSCAGGYSLNGTEELLCSSSGRWSGALPTCAEVGTPMWSAVLMYSGAVAASLMVLLSAVGAGLLVAKRFKKKGLMDGDNSFWEERENLDFVS